jgi:sulfur-carrier protein adenylyltransferase/sulfurtransferase
MANPSASPDPILSPADAIRFARHLRLPEVGAPGQAKLRAAGVLVVGAGGLGSSALLHLAASGIGRIGIVDPDTVALDNLHRQLLHGMSTLGTAKVDSARRRLAEIDPAMIVETHPVSLTEENALEIADGFDVIVDGTDNLPARRLINRICIRTERPMVFGSAQRFEGQLAVFDARFGPCYRCVFPDSIEVESTESPAQTGVFGPLPGSIGTLQALEALKLVLAIGEPRYDRLLTFDGLSGTFGEIRIKKNPKCPECGSKP